MNDRVRTVVGLAAGVVLSGCLGLHPQPGTVERGSSGLSPGLNPWPGTSGTGGGLSTGLSARPAVVERGSGLRTGLSARPEVVSRGGGLTTGLSPIPSGLERGPMFAFGLDPTPGTPPVVTDRDSAVVAAAVPTTPVAVRKAGSPGATPAPAPAAAAAPAVVKAPPPPPPPPPVQLRLRFPMGRELRYVMTMDQSIRMPAMGEAADTQTAMGMDMTQRVVETLPDGAAVVEQTIDALRFQMTNMMMGELSFDTRKPETVEEFGNSVLAQMQPAVLALPRMAGTKVRITMRPDGTIGDIRGMEEMLGALGGTGMGIDFKQLAGSAGRLPDDEVRTGLSWSVDSVADMPGGGKMTTKGKSTVTAWDPAAKSATVAVEAVLELKTDPAPAEGGAGEDPQAAALREAMKNMKIRDGTVKGEQVMDLARGVNVRVTTSSTMIMEMPNPMDPDAAMELHMTMSMKQELQP